MHNIWDVLRRLVQSKPLTELEQLAAHDIINAHEAENLEPAALDDTAAEEPAGAESGE